MYVLIGLVKIGVLIFEILLMLIDYRIIRVWNTVEMAGGGDIYRQSPIFSIFLINLFSLILQIW